MKIKEQIIELLEDKNLYEGDYEANLVNAIKKDLKKKGYTSRQVSVTKRRGGFSSAINILVKDMLNVDLGYIQDIVKKYQNIDKDERTGEILSGGNTYIFVEYDYSTLNKEYSGVMQKLINKLVALKGRYLELKPGFEVSLVGGEAGGLNEKFGVFEKGKKGRFVKRDELLVLLAKKKIKESDIK